MCRWWRQFKLCTLSLEELQEAVRVLEQHHVPVLTPGDVQHIASQGTERIGSGYYGSCVKVVHPDTQQPLVIKTFSKFGNGLSDLVYEATNLQYLRQVPGVQRLVGVCVQTRQMITHFRGTTAQHYFKRAAPSLADTFSVFWQISRTLQQVLDKGLAHNDIKADNVCIQADSDGPRATIIDFGLADKVGNVLNYRKPSHPSHYPWLAPEVTRHTHPCGEASDVYSLACLIKQSLPARSRPRQQPSLAPLRELVRRGKLITPGKRPRLSEFTELLQQMYHEAASSADH